MASNEFMMSSLYFKNLHPFVDKLLIYHQFSDIGPIESIRLCLYNGTKQSLGFGYINFQKQESARDALQKMSCGKLKLPFKLIPCRANLLEQKSYGGLIYVSNIHDEMSQKEFDKIYGKYGDILSSKIFTDDPGRCDGYVHFETKESASAAARNTHEMSYKGRKLNVLISEVEFDEWTCNSVDNNEFTNVFVRNFGQDVDDTEFYKLFEKFGKITSSKVEKDNRNLSKGFGFVNFKDSKSAKAAISAMNGYCLNGREIQCFPHKKKAERKKELKEKRLGIPLEDLSINDAPTNVRVSNLHESIDDQLLTKIFKRYGELTKAFVKRGNDGKSKFYGFVSYSTPEAATKAVNERDGKEAIDGMKPLSVELASNKEVVRAATTRSKTQPPSHKKPIGYPIQNNPGFPSKEIQTGEETLECKSVFVKHLGQDIDKNKVFDLFKAYGFIESTNVPQDSKGKPRGIAFVNYRHATSAKRAIEALDKSEYEGNRLHCSFPLRKPNDEEDNASVDMENHEESTSVFVKHLGQDINENKVFNLFKAYGHIENIRIMRDNMGKPQGTAFVNYGHANSAKRAIEALDKSEYEGNRLHCSFPLRKPKIAIFPGSSDSKANLKSSKVIVKNLPKDIDKRGLFIIFAPYADCITDVELVLDDNDRPTGYAVITFQDYPSAEKAVKDVNGKEHKGRRLECRLK